MDCFLVTGGAGFVGSHMVDHLLRTYPESRVVCLDKLSYACGYLTRNLENAQQHANFEFVALDLAASYDETHHVAAQMLRAHRHVTVFNFAAESCVDLSFDDPVYFTKNNVLLTQYLLEAMRQFLDKNPLRRPHVAFVHISTDEVYGEQRPGENVAESGALRPSNPYAATKAACDLLVDAYVCSYAMPVVKIRSNNIYGPRQYPEKLVSVAMQCLQSAKPEGLAEELRIPIHGTGAHLRKYLHVLDFVRAADLVLATHRRLQTFGDTYNVGLPDEVSNLELVRLVCECVMLAKFGATDVTLDRFVRHVADRRYNDSRYSLDVTKISALGWAPQVSLRQGIAELVEGLL